MHTLCLFLIGLLIIPLSILAGPDLTANIEVLDPIGPDIQYRYTLTNASDAFIGKSFHNYILLSEDMNITTSDYLVADHSQFTLAAGASFTSSVITKRVGHFPAGEYYLGIYADANAVVLENDEKNNTGFDGSSKIVIDALPDLVVDAVTVTDPDGPNVSFEFSIINIGNTIPNDPYHVPVYLSSDTQVGSDDDYHFITGYISEDPIPGGTHYHSLTKESLDSAP